jgi:hypothetical protein
MYILICKLFFTHNMKNLNELIKNISDDNYNNVKINFDKDFGDKNTVLKLANKLERENIISIINEHYSWVEVKKEKKLYLIIDEFNYDFDKYLKSKKENLEINNLKLQSLDIKFRWGISIFTFTAGIVLEYKVQIIKAIHNLLLKL